MGMSLFFTGWVLLSQNGDFGSPEMHKTWSRLPLAGQSNQRHGHFHELGSDSAPGGGGRWRRWEVPRMPQEAGGEGGLVTLRLGPELASPFPCYMPIMACQQVPEGGASGICPLQARV